jgi:four helix bundle protein
MYKTFKDMPVWKATLEMSFEIFKITAPFPRSEDYGLTSQIRRSANSVSGNIAEGFGRKTSKDKANFYIIARGSVFETQSHLIYASKVGYTATEITQELLNKYDQIIYELNKILKSLK